MMNNGLKIERTVALALGMIFALPALAQNASLAKIEWLPGLTVRVGEGINAAYRNTNSTGQSSEMWLHTNCRTGEKMLLFVNTQPLNGFRLYDTNVADRYTPAQSVKPAADSPLMTKPELNICEQNVPEPKWAGLSSTEQGGDKLFIDVNNSLREGKMLKARLATDYDNIHYDEKYGAPYSVKIQDVMLNCANAKSMSINTFLLDNQGRVTDAESSKETTFTKLPLEMVGVEKTLCAISDLPHFKGTGMLIWRNKEVADRAPVKPDLEHNTPVALQRYGLTEKVTNVIGNTFSDPRQKPAFRSISYTQASVKNKLKVKEKIDAQPDGTTLTVSQMTLGGVVFYSQYQRLFNIVDVKKWNIQTEAPWLSKTLENGITLSLEPGKAYSLRSLMSNKDKPDTEQNLSQTCIAGKEWQNAADIDTNFPGRYLEFVCKNESDNDKEASDDYAYLEDLNTFINIGFKNSAEVRRFIFTDVEVVR